MTIIMKSEPTPSDRSCVAPPGPTGGRIGEILGRHALLASRTLLATRPGFLHGFDGKIVKSLVHPAWARLNVCDHYANDRRRSDG